MKRFKILPFTLFFILFIFNNSYADKNINSFADSLNLWSKNLQGSVTSVSNNNIRVKLNKQNKIVKGTVFNVTRFGEELINPVTNKSLGRKVHTIGTFTVTSSDNLNLSGIYKGSSKARVGDKVVIKLPVNVTTKINSKNDLFRAELLYAVFKDGNFIESEKSDYQIVCNEETSRNVNCSLNFKGNADIITSSITIENKNKLDISNMAINNRKIKENAISVAIGKPFGDDKGVFVAVAEKKSITFYEYDNGELDKYKTLEGDFDDVVNIELVDVNNNGIDEVYISNLKYGTRVESYVYEYKDDDFNLEISREPYLFRTYYVDGEKVLMAQVFENGDFTSSIMEYKYRDELYSIGDKLGSLSGLRLYNYGESSVGEVTYNTVGSILIKNTEGKLVEYKGFFSDTPHKLKYARQIFVTSNVGGIDNVDEEILSIGIYPRVLEIDNGKFFLQSNEPKERKTVNDDKYIKSYYGIYSLIDGKVEKLWQSEDKDSTIIESDVVKDDKNAYVVVLYKSDKKVFKSQKSHIEVIKLNLN